MTAEDINSRIKPHMDGLILPAVAEAMPPHKFIYHVAAQAAHFSVIADDRPVEEHIAFLIAVAGGIPAYLESIGIVLAPVSKN